MGVAGAKGVEPVIVNEGSGEPGGGLFQWFALGSEDAFELASGFLEVEVDGVQVRRLPMYCVSGSETGRSWKPSFM
jgi:hypothetical protein